MNKSKTKLYLIRHATTPWNERDQLGGTYDALLSKNGVKMARLLKKEIKKISYDTLLSSPLLRAVQTAKLATGKKPTIEPLAIERDVGEFTGLFNDEVCKRFKYAKHYEFKDHSLHDGNKEGETLRDLYKRAEKLLKKLKKEYKGKTVLLVTHSDLIKMLNGLILDLPFKKAITVYIKNGSIREYDI